MSSGLFDRLRRVVAPPHENAVQSGLSIRLVAGLGNPGREYGGTRHNVGFWLINRLARRHGINLKTSGQAALGTGRIGGREVALAKPRAAVNASGQAIWNLVKRLKLDDAQELLVVCDDLDLPVAKVRMRAGGGHGGHNGLRSIVAAVGGDQFPRIRIGIGRPLLNGKPTYQPDIIADYVLSDPPPDERELLNAAIERVIAAIEVALADGVERAMGDLNRKDE